MGNIENECNAMGSEPKKEPIITLGANGRFYHGNSITKIVMTRDIIKVGCLYISPEAAKQIMKVYKDNFDFAREITL